MTTNIYDVKLREGSFTVECEHITTTGGDYDFFNGWGREAETLATVPRENVLSVVRRVEQAEGPTQPLTETSPGIIGADQWTRLFERGTRVGRGVNVSFKTGEVRERRYDMDTKTVTLTIDVHLSEAPTF